MSCAAGRPPSSTTHTTLLYPNVLVYCAVRSVFGIQRRAKEREALHEEREALSLAPKRETLESGA